MRAIEHVRLHLSAATQVVGGAVFLGIIGGLGLSLLVGVLAVPVMLFQAFLWLRYGVWVKISARMFYPQSADTDWIGLNMMLDQLAEGELAATIVVVAGGLLVLSLLAAWVFSCIAEAVDPHVPTR